MITLAAVIPAIIAVMIKITLVRIGNVIVTPFQFFSWRRIQRQNPAGFETDFGICFLNPGSRTNYRLNERVPGGKSPGIFLNDRYIVSVFFRTGYTQKIKSKFFLKAL
jgi:hypothetical protein